MPRPAFAAAVARTFNTDKDLSPKNMVQSLRSELEIRGPIVWKAQHEGAKRDEMGVYIAKGGEPYAFDEQQQSTMDRTLVGDAVNTQSIWDCTTCGACMAACPTLVEHAPKIVKMRTYQVSMESAFPSEAQATLRRLRRPQPQGFRRARGPAEEGRRRFRHPGQ